MSDLDEARERLRARVSELRGYAVSDSYEMEEEAMARADAYALAAVMQAFEAVKLLGVEEAGMVSIDSETFAGILETASAGGPTQAEALALRERLEKEAGDG